MAAKVFECVVASAWQNFEVVKKRWGCALLHKKKHFARFASSFGIFAMLSHATWSLVGHENTQDG